MRFYIPILFLFAASLLSCDGHPKPAQALLDSKVFGTTSASLDTLSFGDTVSENEHQLEALFSDVIEGEYGEQARQLLPQEPEDIYGGHLTFKMEVDPVKRNYFSLKFWGGDGGSVDIGRIYLYIIDGSDEYQVGYRHEGDYMPLSVTNWGEDLPGRFFYSTTLLPLKMTRDKTSITLRLVSTGRLYPLGGSTGTYQYNMTQQSKAIYRAYTHTDAFLNVSDEKKTQLPSPQKTPNTSGAEILEPNGAFTNAVNSWIEGLLEKSVEDMDSGDVAYLALAYKTPETSAYNNEKVLEKIAAIIDVKAHGFFNEDKKDVSGWGGRWGYLAKAFAYLNNALEPFYNIEVDYDEGGVLTRRQAWAEMLYESREYGRLTRSSRNLTNQAMIADGNIYLANKGLQALNDSRAFNEEAALRYIKEASGILPWTGSDLSEGGSYKEFGDSYFQVTKKGLTRERGYVGDSYGEMAYHVAEWYEFSGDESLKQQAVKMLKARAPFRRPDINLVEGNAYQTMRAVSLLAWRGAPESDGELTSKTSYADRATNSLGLRVAGTTGDPTLLSYARQMIEDNMYFSTLDPKSENGLHAFHDYQVLQKTPDTGERLPMTDDLSDYVWADEENAVLALKHKGERLWISAYWQAKFGVNSVARFHYSTPEYDQYGVLETDPIIQTNDWYRRPADLIDKPEGDQWRPPNAPIQAYADELLPKHPMPDDAKSDSPFVGRADFYSMRFGHFFIGINSHPSEKFDLIAPKDIGSAIDLSTGSAYEGSLTVSPQSSIALYLENEAEVTPKPASPMWLTSIAANTTAFLQWQPSSGAQSYRIVRSRDIDGPFETVAENITDFEYTDTSLPTAHTPYFYRIIAENSGGQSYPSMAVNTLFSTLPDEWSVGLIGDSASGSAIYDPDSKRFQINGAGWDIGARSDSFQFTHKKMNGDVSLTARLTDFSGGTNRNKIGLMIRDSLTPEAKTAFVMFSLNEGYIRMGTRTGNGSSMSYQNLESVDTNAPKWLKISRQGNTMTGYVSTDGDNWIEVGEATIAMESEAFIGFAVTSRSDSSQATGFFEEVNLKKISI